MVTNAGKNGFIESLQSSIHGGIIKEEMLCGVQHWSRYTYTTPLQAWATWRWSTA